MAEYHELETEIQNLWDEAHLMLLAENIDHEAADGIVKKLRDCADRAGIAGLEGGARQLRRTADDVAARMKPPNP